jgi:hypothetical protein
MPYIVTTKRTVPTDLGRDEVADAGVLSRRAVATLEEARALAYAKALRRGSLAQMSDDPRMFSEQGGTVGPLPDGTVIEVEQTTWVRLVMYIRRDASPTGGRDGLRPVEASQGDAEAQREILDAYNARQT